jgi:hypothetical protein
MVYKFKPTSDFDQDIEIRLHSENGQFKFYLGRNFTPDAGNYTMFGNEYQPIVYTKLKSNFNDGGTFYITVVP